MRMRKYRSSARYPRVWDGTSRSVIRTIRGRRTRREFIAQGFMTGGASVLLPFAGGAAGESAHRARAAALRTSSGRDRLRHHAGRGDDSLHLLRPLGRRQHRGLERAGRRPQRPARFPQRGGLQQAGASRAPWCRTRSTTSFIDSSLGLRYHSDSAQLRGIKTTFTNTAAMANVTGTHHSRALAERYQHQPAQPDVRHLAGGSAGRAAQSHRHGQLGLGRQLHGPAEHDQRGGAADHDRQRPGYRGPGEHGTVEHLAAQPERRDQRARVDEAHQRREVRRSGQHLRESERRRCECHQAVQACAYTKAAYLLNQYPNPGAVDPDDDPSIVGTSGSGSISPPRSIKAAATSRRPPP